MHKKSNYILPPFNNKIFPQNVPTMNCYIYCLHKIPSLGGVVPVLFNKNKVMVFIVTTFGEGDTAFIHRQVIVITHFSLLVALPISVLLPHF